MQVWNVLHVGRCKYRMQKVVKSLHLGTIAQLCQAISSQLRHVSTIGKKLVEQQCLIHMFPQYGELRPTSGWDQSGSLGHPCKSQRVSCLGSVTAWHSSIGRQTNFAALNQGRQLYSAGRPSRWALAHILVCADVKLRNYSHTPHLFLSVADWMSTILPHMMWASAYISGCFRLHKSTALYFTYWWRMFRF